MTDQTPATEVGRLDEMRRFHNGRHQVKDFCDACALIAMLPAIEAEARADALREAADAVRALERQWDGDEDTVKVGDVLAILDPQP